MKPIHLLSLSLPAFLAACASAAPPATPELVAARQAYATAARSPAAETASCALQNAHASLVRAEHANGTYDVDRRSFAELARKRAEYVSALGQAGVATRERDTAVAQLVQVRLDRRSAFQGATARQQQETARQQQDETRRQQTETRRQGATSMQVSPLMNLADSKITVAEGTEIVITSGLEFPKNSALLSPTAKSKLDAVAAVLRTESPPVRLAIRGFTDSTGAGGINGSLSSERAAAVAYYLAGHGVPDARLHWAGESSSRPVASNATPQGRQVNRRVEIHVVVPSQ